MVNRSPKPDKKKRNLDSDHHLRKVKTLQCCPSAHCSNPAITLSFIRECRTYLHEFDDQERADWARKKINHSYLICQVQIFFLLSSFINGVTCFGQGNSSLSFALPNLNVNVCAKAWFSIYGISQSSFYKYLQQVKSGMVHIPTAQRNPQSSEKMNGALYFLNTFFKQHCDRMPNSSDLHLPCIMLRKDVAERYKRWAISQDQQFLSEVPSYCA
jgi:hypothetical protein